jgi:hypothetical protein
LDLNTWGRYFGCETGRTVFIVLCNGNQEMASMMILKAPMKELFRPEDFAAPPSRLRLAGNGWRISLKALFWCAVAILISLGLGNLG